MNDRRLSRPALAALRAIAVVIALGFLGLVVANACSRQNAYLPATKAGPVFAPAAPPDLAQAAAVVPAPAPNAPALNNAPPVFFPATKAAPVWNPPPPPQPQAPSQQAFPQQKQR